MDVRDVAHATLLRRRATILYEMSIADIFALAFGGGGERESRSHGRIGQDLSLDVAGSFDLELGGLVSKSLDEDPQIPCRDTLQRDRAGLVLSRRCSQAVCGDFASRLLVKMRPCWSGRTSFRRKSSAGSLEGKLVNPPP